MIKITATIFLFPHCSQAIHAETQMKVQTAYEFGPETSEIELKVNCR